MYDFTKEEKNYYISRHTAKVEDKSWSVSI